MFFRKILFYISSNYLQQALSFITSFAIRKFIAPVDFGIWSTLRIFMNYCEYSNLGIFSAIAREIPYYTGRKEFKSARIIKNIAGTFIFSVILLISTAIFCATFFLHMPALVIIGLRAISAMFFFTLIYNYFITILRSYNKFIALSEVIFVNSLFIAFFYITLSFFWHIYGLFLAAVLSLAAIVIYTFLKYRKILAFKFIKNLKQLKQIKTLLKIGIGMTAMGFFYTFFVTSEKWVIVRLLGLEKMGFYSIATMAYEATAGICMLIAHVSFTEAQNIYGKMQKEGSLDKNIKKYVSELTQRMSCILPIITALIYIWGGWAVAKVIPKYSPGVSSMNILLIGSLFMGLSYFAYHFMMTINKHLLTIPLFAICSAITIFSSITLIRLGFGLNGAAISASIGYFIFFMTVTYLAFKNIHSNKELLLIYSKIFAVLAYYSLAIFLATRINLGSGIISCSLRSTIFLILSIPIALKLNSQTNIFKKFKLLFNR